MHTSVYPLSALQVEKDGNCPWESDTTALALCCDTVCLHITFLPFFRKKSMLWLFKKPSIIMKRNIVIPFIRSFFQSICNTHCQSLIVYTRAQTDTTHSPWTATHSVVIRAEFSYVTAFAPLISETTKSTNTLCTEPRLKGGEMTGLSPAPWPGDTFNSFQTAKHIPSKEEKLWGPFLSPVLPLTPAFLHIVSRQQNTWNG